MGLSDKIQGINELFTDIHPPRPQAPARRGVVRSSSGGPPSSPSLGYNPLNPCLGCPRYRQKKVPPSIPSECDLVVVGSSPSKPDEEAGSLSFGDELQSVLEEAGFPREKVGLASLVRCRPVGGETYDPKETQQAERHCMALLKQELAKVPNAPMLLLGSRPLGVLTGSFDYGVSAMRGLWVRTILGKVAYVARHPLGIEKQEDGILQAAMYKELSDDLRRLAARVKGAEGPRKIDITIYESPFDAEPLLRRLAAHKHPWVFDIETYDAAETPSRTHVSTDCCHADFRVRGVAIAWGPSAGAWIELMSSEGHQDEARPLLDLAFMSDAIKGAYNGSFDEEGLTYTNWVTEVKNRRWDGMLEIISLSDGRHPSLRLERAVVDQLGYPQYWNGQDKGLIRTLSIGDVGRAAVEDACSTWALSSVLQKRLAKGDYFKWPTSPKE